MKKILLTISVLAILLSGCTSVPMESVEKSNMTKKFDPASDGNAGLYIYRTVGFGGLLRKDIWLDDECIGETAPNTFFYEKVEGGKKYKLSTESEFSPNDLFLVAENGKNYFIQQYIKMGVFVGGAGLKLVEEEQGKKAVQKLKLAKKGTCSNSKEISQ